MPSYFPSSAQSVSVGNILMMIFSLFSVVNFNCTWRVTDVHMQLRDVQTLVHSNYLFL